MGASRLSIPPGWQQPFFVGYTREAQSIQVRPAEIISTLFCGAFCLGLPGQHHQKCENFQRLDSSPQSEHSNWNIFPGLNFSVFSNSLLPCRSDATKNGVSFGKTPQPTISSLMRSVTSLAISRLKPTFKTYALALKTQREP